MLVSQEGGLPQDKVVSITGQEFDLLLGAPLYCDESQAELHSSERLKWACQLNVVMKYKSK